MSVCFWLCVWWMSQKEPKGSQTDETREAAAHCMKALCPWKVALHLVCVSTPVPVNVCAPLTGWSLPLPVNSLNNTHTHTFLARLSQRRVQLAGQYTVLQRVGDEMSMQQITSSRTDKIPFLPPPTQFLIILARLCSTQTLIGHSQWVKRTNFHRHLSTKGSWEEGS